MNFLPPVPVGGECAASGLDKLTYDDIPITAESKARRNDTKTLVDRLTSTRYTIPFNHDTEYRYRLANAKPEADLEEVKAQRQLYVRHRLNPEQAKVFDYALEHRDEILVLQAGPGTGKTFTMLTLSHHLAVTSTVPNVVIYKRDLVHVYRFAANGYTVAQFIMRSLGLDFLQYQVIERQLSRPMSVEHFMNLIVNLIRRLRLCPDRDDFRHPLLVLDEYTVIPKPFLLIIMMTLHRFRIGAVICGDKNQLQNIHNSTHAGQCSAYDIVSAFSTRTFRLSRNERCSDTVYNEKVNFIGSLSNDNPLDEWGYALVSAMFYENIIKRSEITDTLLARYHRHLTETMDVLVKENRVPTSVWYIEKSPSTPVDQVKGLLMGDCGQYLPNPTVRYYRAIRLRADCDNGTPPVKIDADARKWCPGKYMTFLPLVIGNVYFLNTFSERSLCRLENIEWSSSDADGSEIKTVTVRSLNTKQLSRIEKTTCTDVMFEKHATYLLNDGDDAGFNVRGNLYNFPIYPAFSMSIYMSQGRTIRDRVSFILTDSTYQCLYVAVSRVTSSSNINSVVIPHRIQYLVSTVLNFDVTDLQPLTVDVIREKMLHGNYMYYEISTGDNDIIHTALNTLTQSDVDQRRAAREHLKRMVYDKRTRTRVLKPKIMSNEDQFSSCRTTLPFLLKIKNTVIGLAMLAPLESRVWIHEFLKEPEATESLLDGKNPVFNQPGEISKFQALNAVCDITALNTYDPDEDTESFMLRTTKKMQPIVLRKDERLRKEWVIINDTADSDRHSVECAPAFVHAMVHRDKRSKSYIYDLLKKQLRTDPITRPLYLAADDDKSTARKRGVDNGSGGGGGGGDGEISEQTIRQSAAGKTYSKRSRAALLSSTAKHLKLQQEQQQQQQ